MDDGNDRRMDEEVSTDPRSAIDRRRSSLSIRSSDLRVVPIQRSVAAGVERLERSAFPSAIDYEPIESVRCSE